VGVGAVVLVVGVTQVMELQILVAVEEVLTAAHLLAEVVVLGLLLSATLERKKALEVQLLHRVATPFTPLLHLGHSQHDGYQTLPSRNVPQRCTCPL